MHNLPNSGHVFKLQLAAWHVMLFVWFDSLSPIDNISVIKGRVFLGWTSTKLRLMFLLKDTTQWCRWGCYVVKRQKTMYSIFDKRKFAYYFTIKHSTLDKQRICVNTQLKSSKKQLKWNVCVPKSNSNDQYAITCDVIAYHLVHFLSILVIIKMPVVFTSERSI